ncbi:hypothetical protein DEO72_LG2g2547 [Vigna unguiculata]|uniref:Uncharacterized protein n=1 Tax=Vigna unguiculata TaxID=3917 RepID=A0A4D6L144_VIGUN|nr:hypothetical protein DEO72_LG2g2547 [Vigna unguiculata]
MRREKGEGSTRVQKFQTSFSNSTMAATKKEMEEDQQWWASCAKGRKLPERQWGSSLGSRLRIQQWKIGHEDGVRQFKIKAAKWVFVGQLLASKKLDLRDRVDGRI